jgi:hypothetical protein
MPWRHLGEWRYGSTFDLGTDGAEWSASHLDRFIPKERATGNPWIGAWVGPRFGLDAVK